MKVGDLVQHQINSVIGIITELGNRYWDGTQWGFAHVLVSYPCNNSKTTWETPNQLEVINASR
jgi:hypothetical protein